MAICAYSTSWAQTLKLSLYKVAKTNSEEEQEVKIGHRLPPVPIMAIIDFESNEVIIPQSVEDVEIYEIWNDNHSELKYSGSDEFDFIQTVANLNDEPITVVLTTSTYSLIGYPNL